MDLWVVTVILGAVLLGTATARNKSPLMDEEGTRVRNKAAECVFGKQVRELGSTWIPDLGVPIGVLYCMKCECVKHQRKRRIVARVQCRNIKNECPVATCDEPVLLPGRCCKTCPGDNYEADVIGDIVPQNVLDEEEKSSTKHYSALLTERSSLNLKTDFGRIGPISGNNNNVVATGRFIFHKKNLYFSFYISDRAARPRHLQFVDSEGQILEEFILSRGGGLVNSLYQNSTRKVCGVWKRVNHEYRKRFRQEKMFVVLVWGVKDQDEFTLSGQVMKYAALANENFSALLEPTGVIQGGTGTGGTAIVSISASVSPSIYLAVVFNGLFSIDEILDVPINVTLSVDEKKVILQEVVLVKKPNYDLNLIEVRSPVTTADLRLLTRGRLQLTVSSTSKPEVYRLSGNVITRVTCELFQTTLAPSTSEGSNYRTSGLAWVYLNNEGSLVYNVQIDNLKSNPDSATFITLVDGGSKRKTELEDLTPYYNYASGWANGTLAKLSPKVLDPLYSEVLSVNVAFPNNTAFMKGRLVRKFVADARDAPYPYLLKRENYTLPVSAIGIAWLYIDYECGLHYDVSFSGITTPDRKFDLSLELLPMLAPGAPVITKELEEFQGNNVEGSPVNTLNREEINRLNSGVGFLKLKDAQTKVTLLVATVRNVVTPPSCQLPNPDNEVTSIVDQTITQTGDCLYEAKFYQQDTQWMSGSNPCTMCFCQNGANKCFTMECPITTCPPNATLKKENGECCHICVNSTLANRNFPKKCIMNGQTYSPGSRFHPFLIPTGFDSGTECFCDPDTIDIKCQRIATGKNGVENSGDEPDATYPGDDWTASQPPKKVAEKIEAKRVLDAGGCTNKYDERKPYPNGTQYHPIIESLGEYKCVSCKCENGQPRCWRECDRTACERKFKMKRKQQLEPKGGGNPVSCCTFRECKRYRHRKTQQRPQQKS